MNVITYNDLESKCTELVNKYLSNGATISTKTASGGDGTEFKVDLMTKENHLIRIVLNPGRLNKKDLQAIDPSFDLGSLKKDFFFGCDGKELMVLDYGKQSRNIEKRTYNTYWSKEDERCTVLEKVVYIEIGRHCNNRAFVTTLQDYAEYVQIRENRYRKCQWRDDDRAHELLLTEKVKEIALKLRLTEKGYKSYNKVVSVEFIRPTYFSKKDSVYVSSQWVYNEDGESEWRKSYFIEVDEKDVEYGSAIEIKYDDGYGHQKSLTKDLSFGWKDYSTDEQFEWLKTLKGSKLKVRE